MAGLRIAVVFDSPYASWGHDQHLQQLEAEIAKKVDVPEPEMEYQVANALRENGHEIRLLGFQRDLGDLLRRLEEDKPDLVFNCAESFDGDDDLEYVIPSLLEALAIPYVGNAPLGLLASRNKELSKKILTHHGIRVPGFFTCHPGRKPEMPSELAFPLIVKPLGTDASEGIAQASVVQDAESLTERVGFVHERFEQPAICEEFVDGRELYVSIIGNRDQLELLPITELTFDKEKNPPEERIATKAAKWDDAYRKRRGVRNQFARPISVEARERIEYTCRTAYHALELQDFARCDVRLSSNDDVWFIEANANPYIAAGHDFAQSAEKAGMKYPAFIEKLVDTALERMRGRNGNKSRA